MQRHTYVRTMKMADEPLLPRLSPDDLEGAPLMLDRAASRSPTTPRTIAPAARASVPGPRVSPPASVACAGS